MRRMRTIQQAASEIRESDPSTAVREYHIRQMVLSGELPSHKAGRKYLIDLDALLTILGGESATKQQPEAPGNFFQNNVRKIGG